MKICVYGAGAIGGYLAVELALAGNEVCAIARGAHLEALCFLTGSAGDLARCGQ